jgi:large-conductance mechanosensitive channel
MGESSPPHPAGSDPAGSRQPEPAESRTREVAVNLKKVVTWLVVAFVVFYVIQAPEQSAEIVRNAGNALGDAASSLSAFVGSLV